MAAASPHLWAFFNASEAPPAFVPGPQDSGARERVLLLAKYAMQNGPSFVQMVQTNQSSNPEYAFLTAGTPEHSFFRWALYATGCGLSVDQPLPAGFVPPIPYPQQQQQPQQMQQYGAMPQQQYYAAQPSYPQQPYPQHPQAMQYQQPVVQQPPPPQQQQQQQSARPAPPAIPPEVAAGFSQVLDALSGSKESIKASQGWFMACAAYAPGMAYMMASKAAATQDFEKHLHLIFLANDILFKAMQQTTAAAKPEEQNQQQPLDPAVVATVPAAFGPAAGVMLAAAHAAAQASSNPDGSEKLNRMISFWQDKSVFDAATIARLQREMVSGNANALLLANYPPPQAPSSTGPPGHDNQQQQQQQQQSGWGAVPPGGSTPQPPPPQPPISGGWGAPAGVPPAGLPSPQMAAAAAGGGPLAVGGGWGQQPMPPPYHNPQQQQQMTGWGHQAQPQGPWGSYPPGAMPPPGAAYPGAVPPGQVQPEAVPPLPAYSSAVQPPPPAPPSAPFPGQGMGQVPPGMGLGPPGVPPAVSPAVQQLQPLQQPSEPQPEPMSSLAFPPGLIPQLVREKSKYSDAYAPIEPGEIDKAGLPPPPEKDAYLKSRLDKFLLELRDYKPGSSRADLEESRAAARAQQGLEPDSDEELALGSTGSRMARRKALGMGASGFEGRRRRRAALGPVVGGMAEDGTYVGPGGGRGERLGLGAHSQADSTADLGDVYSSYRKLRSTSYHQMIVSGAGVSNMSKGG